MTLFPEMFPGPLGLSLAGKALEQGLWTLDITDIRDHGLGKHRTVDDTPAGGGPGMVMRADVLSEAIGCAHRAGQPLIYLSPRGKVFDQAAAQRLKDAGGATMICGRFEGVDERALEAHGVEEVSLGDFILSGGELAAMAMIDSVIRLLPGVVGDEAVLDEESFSDGLLEYPHYTRPQNWEGRDIPSVLLSGNHKEIAAWRKRKAEDITRSRRPDLWDRYVARNKNEE
ncbi:MAG: tRNA (guanosine(37)-N1)-methyltransferase TrmD [Alphaproteobacteria bacterium]